MKIHFCDLCNESVPQLDLDEGRAFIRKGRVVCLSCDRAMSNPSEGSAGRPFAGASAAHGAAAVATDPTSAVGVATQATAMNSVPAALPQSQPYANAPYAASMSGANAPASAGVNPAMPHAVHAPRRSSSSAGSWIAVLALLFAAGAVYVLGQRVDVIALRSDRAERAIDAQAQYIRGAERVAYQLADSQKALEARIEGRFSDEHARIESSLSELRAQSATLAAELQSVSQTLSAVREETGAGDTDRERKLAELSARIARNEDGERALIQRLSSVEQSLQAAAQPAATISAAPAANAGPGWKSLALDLASPNSGTRWQAVDSLGQTHDLQVVPLLIPMLKDSDVFVRMATARVLGDLNANEAVAALIDALEDVEAPVREASFGALRIITKKDLRFDPLANEAERAKKVKAWREWWKKVEEGAAGSEGKPPSNG